MVDGILGDDTFQVVVEQAARHLPGDAVEIGGRVHDGAGVVLVQVSRAHGTSPGGKLGPLDDTAQQGPLLGDAEELGGDVLHGQIDEAVGAGAFSIGLRLMGDWRRGKGNTQTGGGAGSSGAGLVGEGGYMGLEIAGDGSRGLSLG